MVVAQCLEDSSIDFLGSSKASVNVVFTITEDFRFDNGDETIGLADSSVSSKAPSVFLDSNVRWLTVGDLEDCSPFSESASEVVEFLSSLGKIIKSESSSLILSSWDDSSTSVELDSWDDTLFLEKVDELLAILGGLLDGFFEEDDTGNVFLNIGGGEEKFSVKSSVFFVVFELDGVESLADGTGGFISSEDAPTTGGDLLSVLLEFLSVVFLFHFLY